MPYVPREGDLVFFDDDSPIWEALFAIAGTGRPLHMGIVVKKTNGTLAILEAGPDDTTRVALLDLDKRLPQFDEDFSGTIQIRRCKKELTAEQWRRVIDVNLTGVFLCTQAGFRLMKEQSPRGGRIINNGSISAHTPRPNSAPYTAAKHAITGLTKSTALDGRPFDITCGQIDIGNAATEMTAPMKTGVLQANGTVAVEPTIDADHVARAVLYMANLPLDVNVPFMTVMASQMPFMGRG